MAVSKDCSVITDSLDALSVPSASVVPTASIVSSASTVSGPLSARMLTRSSICFALKLAGNPFYREENGKSGQRPDCHFGSQRGIHFGLGLYICKLICEKCGGSLHIENLSDSSGGVVTAVFGL